MRTHDYRGHAKKQGPTERDKRPRESTTKEKEGITRRGAVGMGKAITGEEAGARDSGRSLA